MGTTTTSFLPVSGFASLAPWLQLAARNGIESRLSWRANLPPGTGFTADTWFRALKERPASLVSRTLARPKAAVRFWARSMAAELKDRAIRVNAVSPGAIDTPIIDGQFKTKEEADAGKEMFKQMTPLGRIGRPEEIAKAILFLALGSAARRPSAEAIAQFGQTDTIAA